MDYNQAFAHQPKSHNDVIEMRLSISHIRDSILFQLHERKKFEQTPYEDICSLAAQLSDKIYTLEGENSKLNSELHSLQRILLAEGTDSAKELYNKLSNTTNVRPQPNETEKKVIIDLQDTLNATQRENNELQKCLSDLRIKLEDKENTCMRLSTCNDEINNKVRELTKTIEHLQDENLSLLCTNKSLEKQNHKLIMECDNLCKEIMIFKRENADRMNAANEREQQERIKREFDANMKEFNEKNLELLNCDNDNAIKDLSSEDDYDYSAPSRVPTALKLSFDAHDGETCAINWFTQTGPRDDYLATGGGCDRKVKLWKIEDKESRLIATYHGSNKSINSIDIDGDNLLATSNDYASRIWSIHDNKLRVTLTGHASKVLAAKFIGRPNAAASCSTDRTVKIWDTIKAACTRTYFAGSMSQDLIYYDNVVITGHFDGLVRCWDLRKSSYEPDKCVKLHNKITSLDLSSDGFQLICSLRDNTVKALDMRTMEILKTYFDDNFKISSDTCRAKFSHDRRYVACGSADGSLFVWDANTTKLEKCLPGSNSAVMACSWSPDGSRVATIDKGKKVSIWS